MLVEPDTIVNARVQVGESGASPSLEALIAVEPALGAFIQESLAAVAGKIALSGAPGQLVQGVHEEVLTLLLTCVQAVRRGHYELWKETTIGTRLEELAPDLKPKPKPKRSRRRSRKPGPDENPPKP